MTTATSPDIADTLRARTRAGCLRLAAAVTPLAGAPVQAEAGELVSAVSQPWGEQLAGPCLALAIEWDHQTMLALLPLATGLLRHTAGGAQETSEALARLAREVSACALPHDVQAADTRAAMVPSGSKWLASAALSADAMALPIALNAADNRSGTLWIAGPAGRAEPLGAGAWRLTARPASSGKPHARRVEQVPHYVRSLLRIDMLVSVMLASKKLTVTDIVEIASGAMIQFEKPCEEQLDFEVNGCQIGRGETVKVGDKFGIRLTSLTLPGERFVPLGKPDRLS